MAYDDKSINIPGLPNGKLLHMERILNSFYKRTTVLYGSSGTGKSTLIYDLMHILKDVVPNWIAIAPTNKQNKAYDNRLPQRCIIEKPTVEKMREILKRQMAAVNTWGKANDIIIMRKLAARANDITLTNTAIRISDASKNAILQLNKRNDMTVADKISQEQNINEIKENQLKYIYKKIIEKHKSTLEKYQLSAEEKFTLKYLRFNPSLCLILDDCAAQIDKWGKDEVVKELFLNGRHYWITTIISMQDDKLLPTDARKNTFNAIFTDQMNATAFFENTRTNGISKSMRLEATKMIEYIFKNLPNGAKNNKKLVYNREDTNAKFRYVVADLHQPFKVGCRKLWEMNDSLPTHNSDKLDKDDKYFQAFNE
jgi:energy-coupling factor transporter ATP-binding protein EcfA2